MEVQEVGTPRRTLVFASMRAPLLSSSSAASTCPNVHAAIRAVALFCVHELQQHIQHCVTLSCVIELQQHVQHCVTVSLSCSSTYSTVSLCHCVTVLQQHIQHCVIHALISEEKGHRTSIYCVIHFRKRTSIHFGNTDIQLHVLPLSSQCTSGVKNMLQRSFKSQSPRAFKPQVSRGQQIISCR